MKLTLKLCLLIFTCIMNASWAQNRETLIDSLMKTSFERGVFNGNVLVMEGDRLVYRNELGSADIQGSKALTAETKFNLGSISKQFSAVGIMILVEKNKLSLEDSVSRYIPQLPHWASKIKIKDLLDYTSGLPVENDDISGDEEAWKVLMNLQNLEAEPGNQYIYSNFNIFLRKRIIESITQNSYEDFLKTTFFKPLQMDSPVIDGVPGTNNIAQAFDTKFIPDVYRPFLSGQVSLDIDDLQKWVVNLHSGKFIGKDSMYRLFNGFKEGHAALGTGIYENEKLKLHWHSGSSNNFQSSVCYFPEEEFLILLMTNKKNMNLGDLTNAIDAILRGQAFEIPKKSFYMSIRAEAYHNGSHEAINLYEMVKNDPAYDTADREGALLRTADYLSRKEKVKDAAGILRFALKEFPASEKAKAKLHELEDHL